MKEIPYPGRDSTSYFEAVADLPWPVFLDSSGNGCDIIAFDPEITLVSRNGLTEICEREKSGHSEEDPFSLLRKFLPGSFRSELPFPGGAIGYLSYDFGLRLQGIEKREKPGSGIPDFCAGIYERAIVVDHARKRAFLVCRDDSREILERISSRKPAQEPFSILGRPEITPSRNEYVSCFEKIGNYIRSGDCYQVNFAQQLEIPCGGDPWALYLSGRKRNPAPYSAYLSHPHAKILSFSPEQFLRVENGRVTTSPIKGTMPRSSDPEIDASNAQALARSVKDRAENLMIVDLLRNDLGKVCRTGSVRVDRLFGIESYRNVHHLVSTVSGELKAGEDAISLLEASFPGGSITGAPKQRAMEIIEELEPFRRGIYCGSIFRLGFDGNLESSISIRTMAVANGKLRLWAGGGIVADSEPGSEYREIRHKARAMIRTLLDSTIPSC